LLDKQLFQDEKFHPYLTQNFFLFRAHRGQSEGDEIYKKFSVRATPTVMIVTSDGREIDRVLGYDPPPEKFKDKLEETYKSENTLLNLNRTHEQDPADIAVLVKLAEKYRSYYAFDKMTEFSGKILQQPEKAKQTLLPLGKDSAEVSAYEYAMYASTFSGLDAVLAFANEFSQSSYLDDVFIDFWRALLNKDQQEKALAAFDKLNEKFPDNESLVGSYLSYCSRSQKKYDRGIALADRIYSAKAGKVDFDFASAYAGLLLEKGDIKTVQSIEKELVQNNPDREKDIRIQLGYLYQEKKKYDLAFEVYESLVKDHPEFYSALYQIGRTAAYSGANLDKGIKSLMKYLQHEPQDGDPTWANARWRLGLIYEYKGDNEAARKEYEAALKLEPDYKAAKDALEKLRGNK
jgi:tetratricopeptide (TPR) repeat protein